MNSKQKNMYTVVVLIILVCIIIILILKKRDLEGLAVLSNMPIMCVARRIL